jgi:hypothetical protein
MTEPTQAQAIKELIEFAQNHIESHEDAAMIERAEAAIRALRNEPDQSANLIVPVREI